MPRVRSLIFFYSVIKKLPTREPSHVDAMYYKTSIYPVAGQNGADKMVRKKWYGQNGTDKMVRTKW